ncbi:MAG: polyprenyl synthetase family protein [Planctomycetota bacterium]
MEVTDGVIEEQEPRTNAGSVGCCAGEHRSSELRHTSEHAGGVSKSGDKDANWHCGCGENRFAAEDTVPSSLYSFVLQVATEIFSEDELCRLVPPKHRKTRMEQGSQPKQSGESGTLASGSDPIAFTETVAYEFLSRGGKQARPFMALATYVALGLEQNPSLAQLGDEALTDPAWQIPDQVKRVAISIESFHKASLVHDDIEDQDEYRYGQPTLHRRYGVASAINVGDYLIGMGYRLVSRDASVLGPETAADVLDILAEAHQRLCEGQGAELYWRDALDKQLQPKDALQIYALKTSPAFEAALMCGARLRGVTRSYEAAFRRFARHIGIAFQILNDLKDWEGDEGNKNSIGGDLLGGRPTVLWALALEKLPQKERDLLLGLPSDNSKSLAARTEQARTLYRQADVFAAARKLVLDQRMAAAEVAREFPEGAMRQLLEYIIESVINRPHGLNSRPNH